MPAEMTDIVEWLLPFFEPTYSPPTDRQYALIILNQPFSLPLLRRLWNACTWKCCADGGGNRLHDLLQDLPASIGHGTDGRTMYRPDIIKGDLDSLRDDVKKYYESQGVPIVRDPNLYSTDLMKCIEELEVRDKAEGTRSDLIILGGLSGRLDQTIHTLSLLHKLRKNQMHIFVVMDDNIAWVLDEGTHRICVNHNVFGQTCGLLPVGVDSTILTTTGLRWNLTDQESSFDGLVSTSNHLVPEEKTVLVKTSRPIWWTMELRPSGLV